MPVGIGRRGIGSRAGIGRRQIANRYAQTFAQAPYVFLPGSNTFTAPRSGVWKFVLWGPGASGSTGVGADGGGAGAYCEYSRRLVVGEAVTLVVGATTRGAGTPASDTTATFAGGLQVVTAGRGGVGVLASGGTASGGDVNINGGSGGTAGANGAAGGGSTGGAGGTASGGVAGGGGAPANAPFRGGRGADANALFAQVPGGGGGGGGSVTSCGADGLILAVFDRD